MGETKINTKEGTENLTILKGDAVVHQNPKELDITNGAIDAPADFLTHKPDNYEGVFAHVEADFEKGIIDLHLNEKDANGEFDFVRGSLVEHDLINKMQLNTGTRMSKDSLIDLIRFNRAYFVKQLEAGEIISQLRNFIATVEKKIQLADDQKGNTKSNLEAALKDIKLKDKFKISIPLFKGISDKTELEVDICIDTSTTSVQFYLISDDLFILLIQERERYMKEQLARLEQFECSIIKVY